MPFVISAFEGSALDNTVVLYDKWPYRVERPVFAVNGLALFTFTPITAPCGFDSGLAFVIIRVLLLLESLQETS